MLKIININDGTIIKVYPNMPDSKFWSTPEYWAEYMEWCKLMEEKQNKLLYYGVV